MDQQKQNEIESRRRGEALKILQLMPEWHAVTEILEGFCALWRKNLLTLHDEDSFEKIAKDRLKWLYRLNGVELLFEQMEEDIKASNKKQQEEDQEDEIKKDRNPYRVEYNE